MYVTLRVLHCLLENFNKDLRKLKSKRDRDVWNKSRVDRFKNRFPYERAGAIYGRALGRIRFVQQQVFSELVTLVTEPRIVSNITNNRYAKKYPGRYKRK